MIKDSDSKLLQGISGSVSNYHLNLIKEHSTKYNVPLTRVVGCLIDNAIEEGLPFGYDLTLPSNNDSHEYADEGGKLLDFLRSKRFGIGLDVLMAIRHDLDISKKALLSVLSDCLENGLIETVKPPGSYFKYPEGYVYYRIKKEKGHDTKRKSKNRVNEYENYLKLKKKYENEE